MHASDRSGDAATQALPPLPSGAADEADLAPGTRIGPYRVEARLGRGGMGDVYLATQLQPVQRKVALKLIRAQAASPLARAYFEVERQALAQMQHPGIARVFDAGTTDDGHPYFAMEFVEGVPLTQYCRDHALDRAARIALFQRLCHGVQHAHQKGIIHRDLKPANVLVREVDGSPQPTLIDFGIALGGSSSADTDVAARVVVRDRAGTLAYMSPEQALGSGRDLDTRSDVYALGVMLCELLTGRDAMQLASNVHASRQTVHATLLAAVGEHAGGTPESAPDATTLLDAARRLPASLRAILRKALATSRDDRYASAAALADDLGRFREHRPLQAIPATRWYLARTFVLRHRLGLAAAGLVTCALLAGIVLALRGRDLARESARHAQLEATKAAQVSEFVRNMLAGIDPQRAKGMDRSLMRLVLDSAAQRAAGELSGQPAVRAEIERTIADSYASIGEPALADTHFTAAREAAQAAGATPAQLARLIARAAQNLGNFAQSRTALERAQQAFALVAGLDATNPDRLWVESVLAGAEGDSGSAEAARLRFEHVLALQRQVLGSDARDTLDTLGGLVIVNSNLARLDQARALAEELVARSRAQYGEDSTRTASAINELAIVAAMQRRFADAEALLAPEQAVYERIYGKDHPMMLRLISNLGSFIRQQGRNEEARPYYERALALAGQLYGPTNSATVIAESNLSLLLRDAGDLAGAERYGRRAVEHADAAFGDNAMRAIMSREYATILIRLQRYDEAERQLDHAWAIFSAAPGYGASHPRAQDVVDSCIELYRAWHKPAALAQWQARKLPATAQQ